MEGRDSPASPARRGKALPSRGRAFQTPRRRTVQPASQPATSYLLLSGTERQTNRGGVCMCVLVSGGKGEGQFPSPLIMSAFCFPDSQLLLEPGDRSHWCVVAYWEEKTRVGRLYGVQEPSLDIFYDLPQGNGFCLGQLNSDNKSQLVQKVRSKIGCGIQLTREVDGVWVYNRSSYPIFIKSATLDNPDSRTLLVHKVFPGFSIKAFDYEKAYSLQRPNDHEFMQQPWTGFTVQISFVKGWGQCYTRQFISSCPCWLEVIFNSR